MNHTISLQKNLSFTSRMMLGIFQASDIQGKPCINSYNRPTNESLTSSCNSNNKKEIQLTRVSANPETL
jgi:hypothetical protein